MSRSQLSRRRSPIAVATVAMLVFTTVAAVWLSAASGEDRRSASPNIVFVLTDDLSWNLVRYMPHVLAMEHAGATFSKYFVTDSLCCPSRTSIMTGLLPHDSGVYSNTGAVGGFTAFLRHDDEYRTFAVRLQHQGYRTAMMGKYLNGYEPGYRLDTGLYIPPGWNDWDVAGNGYHEYNYTLNQNRHLVHYGRAPKAYLTDVLAGLASSQLSRWTGHTGGSGASARRHPFMLEIATFAPHGPFVAARSDMHRFDNIEAPRTPAFNQSDTIGNPPWLNLPPLSLRVIAAMDRAFRQRVRAVQAVDRMIGLLRQQLVTDGLADNTYFVFSSDNGLHMGEHRLKTGKMTAFDTDIKVPLIIDGPGIKPGTSISALADNIDLAPTFEQLAGLKPSAATDGRSLVTLLDGHLPAKWRTAVLVEHRGPNLDPDDPDYQAKDAGNPPSYEAIRFANAVYVEYVDGEREYYDIATDSNELRNIYTALSPQRRTALHDQLTALKACHGAAACQRADSP
jgi:N-acetylglucosamine-6-sulfatase